MRRITRTTRRDYNYSVLCNLADRQVPVDVEARLNANGMFINKLKYKD